MTSAAREKEELIDFFTPCMSEPLTIRQFIDGKEVTTVLTPRQVAKIIIVVGMAAEVMKLVKEG